MIKAIIWKYIHLKILFLLSVSMADTSYITEKIIFISFVEKKKDFICVSTDGTGVYGWDIDTLFHTFL